MTAALAALLLAPALPAAAAPAGGRAASAACGLAARPMAAGPASLALASLRAGWRNIPLPAVESPFARLAPRPMPLGPVRSSPLLPQAALLIAAGAETSARAGGPRDIELAREETAGIFDGSLAQARPAVIPDVSAEQAPAQPGAAQEAPLLRTLIEAAVRDGRLDRKTARELKRAAYTDTLTGAYNRLCLDEEGDRAIGRSRAVITFKLDWLKEINDAHGHAVGDHYLAETARIAARVAGPAGILVRRSPTGFALLTKLSGRKAELLAESIRVAVAFYLAGRRSPVYDLKTREPVRSTIQLGMADVREAVASTLAAAERSRLTAKAAGGDAVADAQGRVLARRSIMGLRRELRAAGLEGLLGRLEGELSRKPRREEISQARDAARILAGVKDAALRRSVEDFLFRNRLSGLYNRRWLDENAAGLMASGRIAGYAALDLDKFGDIDRALGEEQADRILARFGGLLAEAVAGRDAVPLHLSGEEFCLLIGPKEKDVRGLLDGLRRKVQDELGAGALMGDGIAGPGGEPLRITVSIGEARLQPRAGSPLALIIEAGERAELALAKAKSNGRNRVVRERRLTPPRGS